MISQRNDELFGAAVDVLEGDRRAAVAVAVAV